MKQLISNYSFSTVAKTVTFTDFVTVRLERVQLIVDVQLNQVLYNLADPTVSTASVAFNAVTLSAVPAGAVDSDPLMIIYDSALTDPTYDALALPGKAVGTTVQPVPAASTQVGGSDSSGVLHTTYVDSAGRVATFEGGTVDVGAISSAAIQVATTDTLVLASNATRGEFEVCNFSQTDICLAIGTDATWWGAPGSVLITPADCYARETTGAVHAIHNNTRGGVPTGATSDATCLLTVNEWL